MKKEIGILGLGSMGTAITLNLKKKYKVYGYDINKYNKIRRRAEIKIIHLYRTHTEIHPSLAILTVKGKERKGRSEEDEETIARARARPRANQIYGSLRNTATATATVL